MKTKILVVSPNFPYPSTHGGKVDIMRQLEILKDLDLEVDLVICSKDIVHDSDHDHVKQFVDNIYYVKRTGSVWDNFSMEPYQVRSRRLLKNIVLNKHYQWVFVEGEYVMDILSNPTITYDKTLLRINNIEYKYFYQLFLSTFPEISALYYLIDAFKFFFYSSKAMKQCDTLAFVSNDELKWYNDTYPDAKNAFLFIQHFDVSKFKSYQPQNTNEVAFVGSLFMPNNLQGLKWYIDEVHPKLLSVPGYNLKIVGSTGNNELLAQNLKKQFSNIAQAELLTDVPDLASIYDQASVFINPMLSGAGIKVKTLQAIQVGLPVVSTKVGAEGIGLKNETHVFISDNPDIFADNVKKCLLDKQSTAAMVNNAQNFLREIDGKKVLPEILKL